jgi:hypothetical protein
MAISSDVPQTRTREHRCRGPGRQIARIHPIPVYRAPRRISPGIGDFNLSCHPPPPVTDANPESESALADTSRTQPLAPRRLSSARPIWLLPSGIQSLPMLPDPSRPKSPMRAPSTGCCDLTRRSSRGCGPNPLDEGDGSVVIRTKGQAEVWASSVSARIWRRCAKQRPLVGPILPTGMLSSSAISL